MKNLRTIFLVGLTILSVFSFTYVYIGGYHIAHQEDAVIDPEHTTLSLDEENEDIEENETILGAEARIIQSVINVSKKLLQ